MFTCISCKVAFETPDEQRSHFATDWHRYNMKRRVANLPPIAVDTFNAKVIERREQNAVRADPRGMNCEVCKKSFSTENAFRSHVQSRKHREKESAATIANANATSSNIAAFLDQASSTEQSTSGPVPASSSANKAAVQDVDDDDDDEGDQDEEVEDEDEELDFDARLAAARNRIKPTDCLFCTRSLTDMPAALEHMSRFHSFFIPDREELVDEVGLLLYLGEKVSIGNLCLYCPNGGREFSSVDAVRKHMQDKAHCKIAFNTHEDRVELADFYDWGGGADDEEWEDVDGEDGEEMEVDGNERRTGRSQRLTGASLPSLAADGLSLQLPNGRTLGHRALRVYYNQRLRPSVDDDEPKRSIKDAINKERGLVPASGGYGAFGKGQELVKARNAGEAAWAKKQAGSHWESRKAEAQRSRVAMKVHNNQKHFRDPNMP